MEITISLPLAFVAGVVSFLSPCILPVVPSYLAFVSGLTLEELRDGTVSGARRVAALSTDADGLFAARRRRGLRRAGLLFGR